MPKFIQALPELHRRSDRQTKFPTIQTDAIQLVHLPRRAKEQWKVLLCSVQATICVRTGQTPTVGRSTLDAPESQGT